MSSTRADSGSDTVESEPDSPNIVYILADDLGYGDVGCFNDDSRIPTPNLDRLAARGRTFTDAHAPSAVCTPTRYSVLTGRYCWRTRLDRGVLWAWDPPLIEADRLTVPEFLANNGYDTACIGKWHLGWDWPVDADGSTAGRSTADESEYAESVDFSKPISGGPTDRGFDYYFGDDVPNFPPYTWIENDRIVDQPTAEKPAEWEGVDGPMAPGWALESVMPVLTNRAFEYVETTGETPFFLYFALTAPHTPIVPEDRFRGRSEAGAYGDYVCQVDWTVGQILDALSRRGIADNTLVIFTSDNGPEHLDAHEHANAYDRIREYGHYSMDGWRGLKRDTWEGGHRVPFIACWPDVVPAGTESPETICQTDLLRTVASIVGVDLPDGAGPDSYDVLPALRGDELDEPIREATVYHGSDGSLAIRRHEWVLIDAETGDIAGEPDWYREERGYVEHDQPGELYDLAADPLQRTNLYAERPATVETLQSLLDSYIEAGRSAPTSYD